MTQSSEAVRRTPLHPVTQALNAEFVARQGWQVTEWFTNPEAECAAARGRVVLADESANGKIGVEGERAEDALETAFDLPLPDIGCGSSANSNRIYRLRKDLFFVSTPPGRELAASKDMRLAAEEVGEFVTVTDLTHARSEIRIIGPHGRELLSKVCGLDFYPDAFDNGTAKLSSLAKTTQLIIRRDIGKLPAFSIIGAGSLGRYLWKTLEQAGKEFGIEPIGHKALNALDGRS